MKPKAALILFAVLTPVAIRAQGTFVYDQQSHNHSIPANITYPIQQNSPIGQSFVPGLPSIGFVQLELFDGISLNGVGATVHVDLHAESITGPVLSSTEPLSMPDKFGGVATFIFANPQDLTAGTAYYIEPIVDSGDVWTVNADTDVYPGGTAYIQGAPVNGDLWFREGVLIPEPAPAWLAMLGAATFAVWARAVRRNSGSGVRARR